MNTITATITKFIGEPIHRKAANYEYYYRKCKVSHIGGESETEIIANTYQKIMAYKIGDEIEI